MDSIMNHLPKVHSDSNDLVDYLNHIYDAANDIEQIAKSLKVMPIIEPYADNILGSIIIIRANLNCIQDIPHIYDKTADVQPVDRWINAKTNPPIATDGETSDYVLVLRASGMQCVCYYVYDDDEGNYWCSEDEKSIYDIDEITRWQPLPEPPKDGEQNDI